MDFAQALLDIKSGRKVARAGWNGKGMFLFLVSEWRCWPDVHVADSFNTLPFIAMKTAKRPDSNHEEIVPWLASQTDILATDWEVVL